MRYPWADQPQTLEYLVMHCVEDAGGCAHHFQFQLKGKGCDFSLKQISGALHRLKKKELVENQGNYWRLGIGFLSAGLTS